MGAKDKRKKPPKIVDAEITDDGMLVIELNQSVPLGNSKKVIFPAETIFALAEECSSMPPASATDYPGVPVVEVEDVFDDDEPAPDQGEEDDGSEDDP